MQGDPAFVRFLRREIAISTLMNGLVPGVAVYLTYDPLPIAAWGGGGYVVFAWRMIPVIAFGMTLIMTAVMRSRRAKGGVPGVPPTAASMPWLRRLPRSLWLRGLCMALAACAVLGPLCALAGWLMPTQLLDRAGFAAYVFSVGAAIGLFVTPPVILAALATPAPSPDTAQSARAEKPHAHV